MAVANDKVRQQMNTVYVWEQILDLVRQLSYDSNHPRTRRHFLDLAGGLGAAWEAGAVARLQAIVDEFWDVIQKTLPERFTKHVYLHKRETWDAILDPKSEGRRSRVIRSLVLEELRKAADYVITRETMRQHATSESPGSPQKQATHESPNRASESLDGNAEEVSEPDERRQADERYAWARQIDLVKATNQVLGDGELNRGVLSRACRNGDVGTNNKRGQGSRVRVTSFLAWVSKQRELAKNEETQIRNAIMGEISSRNS